MNKIITLDLTVEVHESVPTLEVIQKITRMLNKRGGIESLSIGASNPIPCTVPKTNKHVDN